jgi:hypothetical protein
MHAHISPSVHAIALPTANTAQACHAWMPYYPRSCQCDAQHNSHLQAGEFTYAKSIAESHTGAKVTDCVVLVPPHFGPHQRQAIKDAVQLSGLNLLSLMNTHAAAALQYGIERDFIGKTEDVIMYDVASTDVVAALVRFSAFAVRGSSKQQSQFQVLDVTWKENTGASFLDMLLVKHFIKQVSLAVLSRSYARLLCKAGLEHHVSLVTGSRAEVACSSRRSMEARTWPPNQRWSPSWLSQCGAQRRC